MSDESSEIQSGIKSASVLELWAFLQEAIRKEDRTNILQSLHYIGEKVASLPPRPTTMVVISTKPSTFWKKNAVPTTAVIKKTSSIPLTPAELLQLPQEIRDLLVGAEQTLNQTLKPLENALKSGTETSKIPELIKQNYWLVLAMTQKLGAYINLLSRETLLRIGQIGWDPHLFPKEKCAQFWETHDRSINDYHIGPMSEHCNGDLEKTIPHSLYAALSTNSQFAVKMLFQSKEEKDMARKEHKKKTGKKEEEKEKDTTWGNPYLVGENLDTLMRTSRKAVREEVSMYYKVYAVLLAKTYATQKSSKKAEKRTDFLIAAIIPIIMAYNVVLPKKLLEYDNEKEKEPDKCPVM